MEGDPSATAASREAPEPGKTPPDEKLLEIARQEQENARNAFSRDLRVALVALAAFQFLIFPRFVQLSEDTHVNNQQLERLKVQENATQELQTALRSLQSALDSGASLVSKRLAKMPDELHQQTTKLDSEIKELRDSGGAGSDVRSSMMVQMPLQTTGRGFLSGLSEDERKRVASPDERTFRAAISPIVRAKIIQPAFMELNSELAADLKDPFAEGTRRVDAVLNQRSSALKAAHTDPDAIRDDLLAGQARLSQLHFIVPESDSWWSTVEGKGGHFREQNLNTTKVTEELQRQLSRLNSESSATESRIAALLHQTEANRESLQAGMKELEEELQAMHDALADEAKPFKLLAIELRGAVLYFPIAIALAYAYLTFEYVSLGGRVRHLQRVYRNQGYGAETLRIYFSNVPATTILSAGLIGAVLALPVAMCFWSVHLIHKSSTLAGAASSGLYVFAELLVCACFVMNLICATRVASSFSKAASN